MTANRWLQLIEENPGHSAWYVERFRSMAAAGHDLDGEARFVDALVPRRAKVLDAGCGPGRVGGRLAALGHDVVGVDLDPELVVAAQQDHPGPTWLCADLADLDLPAMGIRHRFDAVVCAGNVMTFLDPSTRRPALDRLASHLAPEGRIVVGFGADRGYTFEEFFEDVATVGLREELRLSTWDLRPLRPSSDFLVSVVAR
jgi:SAM-dependent methyltransferase